MNINEILTKLKPEMLAYAEQQRSIWHKSFLEDINPAIKILENKLTEISVFPDNEKLIFESRKILYLTLHHLLQKDLSWKYSPDESESCLQQFQSNSLNYVSGIEKESIIELKNEDRKYDKNDNLDLFFWKLGKSVEFNLENLTNRISNKIRINRKMPPRELPVKTRTFNNHLFFNYFTIIPLSRILLIEWKRFIRLYTNQIKTIQNHFDQITNLLLLKYDSNNQMEVLDPESLKASITTVLQEISELKTPEPGLKEFGANFEKIWEEIAIDVNQKWIHAGTSLLPSRRYGTGRFQEEIQKLNAEEKEAIKSWKDHHEVLQGEWRKDVELGLFQLGIIQTFYDIENIVSQKISESIIPVFLKGRKIITNSLKIIAQDTEIEANELYEFISEESGKILNKLRGEALPEMLDVILKSNIERSINNYISLIESAHENLSDVHIVLIKREDESLVPKSKIERIPLKELADIELLNGVRDLHQVHLNEVEATLKRINRSISEIDQIVEFNLEAALNLLKDRTLKKGTENPQKTITEGLQRTLKQIEELVAELNKLETFISNSLENISVKLIDQLENLFNNDRAIEHKIRLTKARSREEFQHRRREIINNITGTIPAFVSFVKRTVSLIQAYRFRISKLTGLTSESVRLEEQLRTYLFDAERRAQQLPYVYQRLFRTEPWVDERFFEGREKELESISDDLAKWEKGYYTNTILVGEKGSGKTTFVSYVKLKLFKGHRVYHCENLKDIQTTEELLEILKVTFEVENVDSFVDLEKRLKRRKPCICIFENLNNLYLRKMDGFQVLDSFLHFVSDTGNRIFWIQSCSLYGWKFLNYSKKISRYYSRILTLDSLDRKDIENILLKRHRVSGYELKFSIPETDEKAKQLKKINDPVKLQSYLHKNYFEKLRTVASGNILVAMMYWLKSFVSEENGVVTITAVNDFDFLSFLQLPIEDLFALGLLIQHGELESDLYGKCMNMDDSESSHQLTKLKNLGILLTNGDTFRVHPLLYRPVVKALKTKNILH